MARPRLWLLSELAAGSARDLGDLANFDQVAIRVANVSADLHSVIFRTSQELDPSSCPLLVDRCDVGDAHVDESARTCRIRRCAEVDARLVVRGLTASDKRQPG